MGLKTLPAPVQPDLLEINSRLNIVNPALKRQIKIEKREKLWQYKWNTKKMLKLQR